MGVEVVAAYSADSGVFLEQRKPQNCIQGSHPRGRDLNLEPAENKTAGASTDRSTTPFCDAPRALTADKEMPLVGMCLI
jgi:hypothetical protein